MKWEKNLLLDIVQHWMFPECLTSIFWKVLCVHVCVFFRCLTFFSCLLGRPCLTLLPYLPYYRIKVPCLWHASPGWGRASLQAPSAVPQCPIFSPQQSWGMGLGQGPWVPLWLVGWVTVSSEKAPAGTLPHLHPGHKLVVWVSTSLPWPQKRWEEPGTARPAP